MAVVNASDVLTSEYIASVGPIKKHVYFVNPQLGGIDVLANEDTTLSSKLARPLWVGLSVGGNRGNVDQIISVEVDTDESSSTFKQITIFDGDNVYTTVTLAITTYGF